MNYDAFDPREIRAQCWGYLKYLNGLQDEWTLLSVTASKTLAREILAIRREIRMWTMVDEAISRETTVSEE